MIERRQSGGARGMLVAVVALIAAMAWAVPAQANVTLPADNGKIAFASDRDAPPGPPPVVVGKAPSFRQGDDNCFGSQAPARAGATQPSPRYGNNDCWLDVFTVNPDGSGLSNLTSTNGGDHAYDDDPSWSPDGTKIAFTSDRACAAGYYGNTTEEFCPTSLYVMNANGSDVRRLTAPSVDNRESDFHPTWSPNGGQIAFSRFSNDGARNGLWVVDGSTTSDGSTDAATKLNFDPVSDPNVTFTQDVDPAWSPDGKTIGFTRFIVSGEVPLTLATAVRNYSVLGDQKSLEYARSTLKALQAEKSLIVIDPELFLISSSIAKGDISTGAVTQATNPQACPFVFIIPLPIGGDCQFDNRAAWSPDGSRIAFDRETVGALQLDAVTSDAPQRDLVPFVNDNTDIWDVPSAGGTERSLAPDPATDCSTPSEASVQLYLTDACHADVKPAYSPDGTQMAIQSDRPDPDCFGFGLFILFNGSSCNTDVFTQPAADGTSAVALAADGHQDVRPDWQPIYKPPTTAASVPACQTSGAVTVDATANAGDYGAPKAVHYKIDGGAEQTAPVSAGKASINMPAGTHTLEYWGENQAGAQEAAHHATPVKVDLVNNCAGQPQLSVAGVRRACISSSLKVRIAVKTAGKVKQVRVYLDGKRILTSKKSTFSLRINARKLKAGRHRLTTVAVDAVGNSVRSTRTIARCAQAKPKQKAAPRFTG